MRYIGLDLGSRRLGISMSDKTGLIASSYKVITHNEEYDKLVDEIVNIVKENNVDGIVLGLPKNMNNTMGEKANLSMDFKSKLESVIDVPIYLEDERLSTVEAHNVMISEGARRDKIKEKVDAVAATIILQRFLDRRS